MSFAFRNIILNQSTLSQSGGRLSIGGVPVAFLSEAAGGVTGLTVGSGDARYVSLTGAQTISGAKVFAGSLDAGNRYLIGADGYINLDWDDRAVFSQGVTKLDWGVNEVYGVWTHTGAATTSGHIANYHAVTGYSYPRSTNPSGYVTGSVVRATETGAFVSTGQTGVFYPRTNPSGYLAGVPSDVVRTTGTQTISGSKTFGEAGELRGRWKYTGHTAFANDIVMPDDIASYRNVTDYAYPASNPSGYFNKSGASVLYATYGASYPSVDLDQGILYTNYYNTSGHSIDYNGMNLYNGKTGSERKLRANWDLGELYDSNEAQSITWLERILSTSAGFSDVSLNWETRSLFDIAGNLVLDWDTSHVYGESGLYSIGWADRLLYDNSPSICVSADWNNRKLYSVTGAGTVQTTLDWQNRVLSGNWQTNCVPTATGHIVNKAYVDSVVGASSGVYTLQLSHNQFSPADTLTYYIAAAVGHTPITTQSSSPVIAVPTSGVLRKIIGTAFVAGTLGTSETVSLIVYKNGTSVATGSYLASGRNNTIVSGLSGLSVPVGYLDTLQLAMVCPTWATNPTNLTNSLSAYVSLG
jgi:hypothetical protein